MPVCEMCGKGANLINADVEGVELKLCQNCLKYGVVKKSSSSFSMGGSFKKRIVNKDEPEFKVVNNYSSLLRSARESKNMNQEDFAKFLKERSSIVTKWESGNLKPRVGIARKLSKLLNINLIEKDIKKDFEKKQNKRKEEGFTLGDFIKVRKRK